MARIVKASWGILPEVPPRKSIARSAWVCYQTEKKTDKASILNFLMSLYSNRHYSTYEFAYFYIYVDFFYSIFQPENENLGHHQLSKTFTHKHVSFTPHGGTGFIVSGSARAILDYVDTENDEDTFIGGHGYEEAAECARWYLLNKTELSFLKEIQPIKQNSIAEHLYPLSKLNRDYEGVEISEIESDMVAKLYPEIFSTTVKFIVNRAVSHELVRHRPCSFLQESQRYCNYSAGKFGNEVTFIEPCFFRKGSSLYPDWLDEVGFSEARYFDLLENGASPQAARTVLPNSCKTELHVRATGKQWQHIDRLRTSKAADPSMREVMVPLMEEMRARGMVR